MPVVSRREAVVTALGFLLLSLVACYPAGLSPAMFTSGGDAVQGYFPLMVRAFQPAREHLIGPWDATTFTGLPESHHPFGTYYPPTMLLYGLLPAGLAMSLSLIWHHALAAVGAYLLARCWLLSRMAASLAGIVFGFGGFVVWHRCHVPMMQVAAWVPWVLLALECYRQRGSMPRMVLAGTLMAVQALAGHLQMVVYSGVLWLTFLGYFLIVGPGPACGRWRFAAGVIVACLLGAAGSVPQNLPMLEVSGWSGYNATSRSFFGDGCLKVRFLVGLLGRWILGGSEGVPVPGGYSPGEFGIFYGMLPLCLAIFGMVAYRSRRGRPSMDASCRPADFGQQLCDTAKANRPAACRHEVDAQPTLGFWMAVLIVNVLLMLGKGIELDALLYHVPVYNLFHVSARHICFVGLALAMFAGYGLDRLAERDRCARWLRQAALILAGSAVAAVVILATMKSWPQRPPWYYWGFLVPVGSAVASLVLMRLAVLKLRWLVVVLPALAFLELRWSLADVDIQPTSPASLTQAAHWPEAIQWLHENWHDVGPPRCLLASEWLPGPGQGWWTQSAFSSAWCIASMNGYNQSLPRSLVDLLRLNRHGFSDLGEALAEERGLSAAGTRYFLSSKTPPTIAPGLASVVDRVTKAGVYLVEGSFACALPIPGKVRAETSSREGVRVLAESNIGPEDFSGGTQRFLLVLALEGDPLVDVNVLPDRPPLQAPRVRIWKMTEAFAPQARALPPARLAELLASRESWPFPLRHETCDGVRIYELPGARPLATLVKEIQRADSDLDASRQARKPGSPVAEVAHVVGQPAAALTAGKVTCKTYAPDLLRLTADTPGQSFLVLSVTRCRGWTASVDGQPTPIHAVDGPFMGVFIPPGTHQVEFRFRPVLHQAGLAMGGCCLVAGWLMVVVVAVRRRAAPPPVNVQWHAKQAA